MAQLRQDYQEFVKRNTEVIAVGPEKAKSFQQYWQKENLPFIGLPDPNQTVLKIYGQEFKLLKLGRMPAQMLVDKSGILRFVHYGSSMSDIPSDTEIFESLESIESI